MYFRNTFALLGAPAAFIILTCANALAVEPRPLSLSQAIDSAFVRNPDLRLSALALTGADATVEIASAKPNPTLTVQTAGINPGLGIGAGPIRSKTVDSTLRLDQLIERGGKRDFRIANAVELKRAAANDLRDVRRRLRQAVSAAYYDLLAAHNKLDIARESAQLFDSTVQAAEKRRAAGDLAGADVARARIDAARARNDVAQAESDFVAMRQALNLLIGDPDDGEIVPTDSWPAGQVILPTGDSADLLKRPEVLAAKARLNAATSAQQLARASRHADITVSLQAEHYPASAANPQGSGNSYGVALQFPLMVRYAFAGEIRAADVAVDTARESLDKVVAAARSEARSSNERARAAFERVRRYDDELLPLATKAADAAEFAFAHGALGIMDLLDVRRTYRSAQLEALNARADYAKALATAQAINLEEGMR
jgi:cobalt-zinc-cadmium efflux system outer membrane protein